MSGAILRRRDRTARSLRVVHYSSAVNSRIQNCNLPARHTQIGPCVPGGVHTNDMGGTLLRSVGLARAKARIGLKNLAYNMRRLLQLNRPAAAV